MDYVVNLYRTIVAKQPRMCPTFSKYYKVIDLFDRGQAPLAAPPPLR